MSEIALHFDIEPGTDAEGAALALAARCQSLPNVSKASSDVISTRGMSEIILFLTLATGGLSAATTTLTALKSVIEAAKGVGKSLGLRKPKIEDGSKTIRVEDLTEADAERLLTTKPD